MALFRSREPTVSLYQKNVDWIFLSKLLTWSLFGIAVITSCNALFSFSLFNLFSGILWASAWKISEKPGVSCQKRFKYRRLLRYFLESNKLFTETFQDGKTYISTSAIIGWKETKNKIIILAYKQGDSYSKRLESLEVELSALLELPLETKIIRPAIVEYHFFTKKPTRLNTSNLSDTHTTDITINLGYGIYYSPVDTPHILVAGGTGSGKSTFISYLILELLRRKSLLFICDPKNSDLGSLSHYLGTERIATTPNQIAKIIRLAVEEMNNRYSFMRAKENFKYGTNFVFHGFKPTWIIFDEMGAFQASGTDRKSKEVINEVMDGIKQIILLGRQAGVFILISAQQMNADTLNTDLRDNLGLRICLGTNSSEGYRMVFGSATPQIRQPIETKGAGYIYLQGSGKDSAEYWESPYLNPNEFDFISELKKYI